MFDGIFEEIKHDVKILILQALIRLYIKEIMQKCEEEKIPVMHSIKVLAIKKEPEGDNDG